MNKNIMTPNVSVLLPTYNMECLVGQAVRSALQYTGPDIEVIVLDDGSTDNTQQVLAPFITVSASDYDPRVRVYRHANRGKSATVNRGFELAKGDYITILDADDELPDESLKTRYDVAKHRAGADLVVGACEVFRGKETLDIWEAPSADSPGQLRRGFYMHPRQPFHLNSCLMSRSLVEKTGYLDPRWNRCHDIDYILRLLKNTKSIVSTNKIAYRYRKYRTSAFQKMQIRWVTLVERIGVTKKNIHGPEQSIAIVAGVSFDLAKMAYEIFVDSYPKI